MSHKEIFLAFLAFHLAVPGVSAGNAWFEPSTRFASSDISNQPSGIIAANDTNRDPFTRGLDRAPGKRWVTVDTSTGSSSNTGIKLWPDKTIKFCFEDVESRGRLYDLIVKGMDLWHQAGLDSAFKMTEVSDDDCKNKRSEVMVVTLGDGLSTTPARPNSEPSSMTLTDSAEVGMLNSISNVAHEIGHAWGMYHEHQNPNFWESPYAHKGGKVFGASNFQCKNLKDYQDALDRIQDKINEWPEEYRDNAEMTFGPHREKICTSRAIAKLYGFSSAEYLPYTDIDLYKAETDDSSQIDWDSIMLYPSGAGGTPQGNGERLPILTRPDGDEIGLNLLPSPRDVAGLMALYGSDTDYDETLHSDTHSGKHTMFSKVRNNDMGLCK